MIWIWGGITMVTSMQAKRKFLPLKRILAKPKPTRAEETMVKPVARTVYTMELR